MHHYHRSRVLALERELGLTVGGHCTPGSLISSLAIVANGGGLPGLIKGLKVEGVVAPVDEGAETGLVETGSVLGSAFRRTVIGTNYKSSKYVCRYKNDVWLELTGSRPAGLAVPDLGKLISTSDLALDMLDSLVHVVEVDLSSIVAASTLPESKGIDQNDVGGSQDGVRSSISVFVPAVSGADFDAISDCRLYSANLVLQLRPGEVPSV